MNISFWKDAARAAMPHPSWDNPVGGEIPGHTVAVTNAPADPAHQERSDIGVVKTPRWKGQWQLIRYL